MRYQSLVCTNSKGFVLPFVLVVLLALTSFSVAMLEVIKSGALKTVKSHQVNTVSSSCRVWFGSWKIMVGRPDV